MDTTFFSLLLGVLIVLYVLIRLTAPFRQQERTNEARWCYGCNAWMRDVEPYWYDDGRTRVLSPLCPDCAFERHATLADEDGFPTGQPL